MGERNRQRVWPAIAAALGIALICALGFWQLDRAAQKRELTARFAARAADAPIRIGPEELNAADVDLRRAEARGVFEPRYAIFIDNRIHRGTAGYHVVMPLRLDASDRYLLVNRGWVARPAHRTQLPPVHTPPGAVSVSGVAIVPSARAFELSHEVIEGPIWQNLTIDRYRALIPIRVQPFVLRQDSASDDGLIRAWDAPDFGIDKHYGYAFQWFALAATLGVFYVVTQFRRKRSGAT